MMSDSRCLSLRPLSAAIQRVAVYETRPVRQLATPPTSNVLNYVKQCSVLYGMTLYYDLYEVVYIRLVN